MSCETVKEIVRAINGWLFALSPALLGEGDSGCEKKEIQKQGRGSKIMDGMGANASRGQEEESSGNMVVL